MTDIHSKWKEENGDESYALNWEINDRSTVWEIGGFEGRWAGQIVERFDPFMEIFEPQGWAVRKLNERFQGNDKVTIHPFGLWVMDVKLPLYHMETDGASLINPGVHSEVLDFRDVYPLMDEDVDLCLMNIEGAEFILLPYMIANGLMNNFRYFWCQFHPGLLQDGEVRYLRIHEGLKATHKVKWNFYPTAVAWERK